MNTSKAIISYCAVCCLKTKCVKQKTPLCCNK